MAEIIEVSLFFFFLMYAHYFLWFLSYHTTHTTTAERRVEKQCRRRSNETQKGGRDMAEIIEVSRVLPFTRYSFTSRLLCTN